MAVLTLLADGGPLPQGISILLILKALMKHIGKEEDLEELPKPCQYFDMMGGTGVGGYVRFSYLSLSSDDVLIGFLP